MDIYYIDNQTQKRKGPYSVNSIPKGQITPNTMVWCSDAGSNQWIRASDASFMEDYFRLIPPEPPIVKTPLRNYNPIVLGVFLLIFNASFAIYVNSSWELIQTKYDLWEIYFLFWTLLFLRFASCFYAHTTASNKGLNSSSTWVFLTFLSPIFLILLGLKNDKEDAHYRPLINNSSGTIPWSVWSNNNPGKSFSDYVKYIRRNEM